MRARASTHGHGSADGGLTHHVDQNNTLLVMPVNGPCASGYCMLFVLNAASVPSVAS
jgi:hypothetical protein